MAKRSQLNNDVRIATLIELDAARRRQCKLTKMPRLRPTLKPTLKSVLRTIKCLITAPTMHPLRVRQCGSNLVVKDHTMKSHQDVTRYAPETSRRTLKKKGMKSTTLPGQPKCCPGRNCPTSGHPSNTPSSSLRSRRHLSSGGKEPRLHAQQVSVEPSLSQQISPTSSEQRQQPSPSAHS